MAGTSSWDVTSPVEVPDYRARLSTGESVVDPETWAGSLRASAGIPPRVRVGRDKWFNLLWLLPIGFVLLLVAVAVAQGLRNMPAVQRFMVRYPGTLSTSTAQGGHAGIPWWVDLQHFVNLVFILFIGLPLAYGHGAPLRLRNEIQHGFKQVKWLAGIDFVADFAEVAGGYGGYNADHEFFGYIHTI
jgi:hypothetical protein